MIFAQFYTDSTGYVEGTIPPVYRKEAVRLVEMLGSDGVAYLDGRYGVKRLHDTAREIGKKRGAKGYRLFAGLSFRDARPLSKISSTRE